MEYEEIIAMNLAQLRKAKGLTQEEFGAEMGYTYQAVPKWERGKSLPNPVAFKTITDYFKVSLYYFFPFIQLSSALKT